MYVEYSFSRPSLKAKETCTGLAAVRRAAAMGGLGPSGNEKLCRVYHSNFVTVVLQSGPNESLYPISWPISGSCLVTSTHLYATLGRYKPSAYRGQINSIINLGKCS